MTSFLMVEEILEYAKTDYIELFAREEWKQFLTERNISLENFQLPDMLTREELDFLLRYGDHTLNFYLFAVNISGELKYGDINAEKVFKREYVENPSTRKQALFLDVMEERVKEFMKNRKVFTEEIEDELLTRENIEEKMKDDSWLRKGIEELLEAAGHAEANAEEIKRRRELHEKAEQVRKQIEVMENLCEAMKDGTVDQYITEVEAKRQESFSKALILATEKHTGQTRKDGSPYIYHPIKVAELLKEAGCNLIYQTAGLLHDVLEDTDATEDEIRGFGEDVLEAVKLVTRPEGMGEEQYVAAILQNKIATAVKNADKIHNMQELIKAPDKKWAKEYAQKVKKYYGGKFSNELDAAIEKAQAQLSDDDKSSNNVFDKLTSIFGGLK